MTSPNPYAAPTAPEGLVPSQHREGLGWLLFSFEGRIPRRTFWLTSLAVTFGTYALLGALVFAIAAPGESDGSVLPSIVLGMAAMLFYIPLLWMSLALQVKRWHDRDKGGAWIFINFIPLIGPIWAFVEVGCLRGTVGANQFGPDPT